MSFIQREILRLREAMGKTDNRRDELYAAQQALEWALEPDGIRSPFQMITGIPAGSADCHAESDPASSGYASV